MKPGGVLSSYGGNIESTEAELRQLGQLLHVDLVMLVSEISDNGWKRAKWTSAAVPAALDESKRRNGAGRRWGFDTRPLADVMDGSFRLVAAVPISRRLGLL